MLTFHMRPEAYTEAHTEIARLWSRSTRRRIGENILFVVSSLALRLERTER